QYNLGVMYANGQGVGQSDAKAFEWYLKAANNGSAMAQFNIGQHYLHGSNGLPKNRVQALNWLKKAANNGHAQAKLVLAGLQ
ncbi:tetratricopeptide repeat protein, partial [Acinetobacter baumannii]